MAGMGSAPGAANVQNHTLFLYRQGHYVLSDLKFGTPGWSDLLAFADFDRNGTMDPLLRGGTAPALPLQQDQYQDRGNLHVMWNGNAPVSPPIRVLMLGPTGQQNQQGRRVTAVAQDGSNFTMTRFVDGGSGYMSNNEYVLTFPTPHGSAYQINAYYASGTVSGVATAGSTVKTYQGGPLVFDATGSPGNGLNLALANPVSVSSDVAANGWTKARAVDGNRNSFSNDYGWSSNSNLGSNHTEWIIVPLITTTTNVAEVDLYPRNDPGAPAGRGYPNDFKIETSVSGTCSTGGGTWTQVYSKTGAPDPGSAVQRIHFTAINAACVRITGTSLRTVNGLYRMQFAEIEVYVNQALNKTVTATSEIGGWPASNAVNGNESSTGGNWSSTNRTVANSTESITVDMVAPRLLSRVDLFPRNNAGFEGLCFPVDFTIQISPTGAAGTWTTVVTRTNYTNPGSAVQRFPFFTNILARFVKVQATKLSSDGSWFRFQLAELEAY